MARAPLPAAVPVIALAAAALAALLPAVPPAGDAAAQLAPPEGAPPGQCCAAGSADGQFSSPEGVDIHYGNGMILVADTGNHRIQVFHPNGTFAFKFGTYGDGDGEFDSPKDVAQGVRRIHRGLIAVADTGNDRVQLFHPNGTFALKFGTYGDGDGEFDSPEGVDFNNGNDDGIFVADTGNHRIQIFSLEGEFAGKLGSRGNGTHQFDSPRDVSDSYLSGLFYVADTGNDRIQIFRGIGTSIDGWTFSERGFRYHSSIGQPPTEVGPVNQDRTGADKLDGPRSVDVQCCRGSHPYYRVAIADTGNDRIQFSASGGLFHSNFGSAGTGDREFWSPSGAAVGSVGEFAFADTGNHRVQVFKATREPAFVLGAAAAPSAPAATLAYMCAVGGRAP